METKQQDVLCDTVGFFSGSPASSSEPSALSIHTQKTGQLVNSWNWTYWKTGKRSAI